MMISKETICLKLIVLHLILFIFQTEAKNDCNFLIKSNRGIYNGCRQTTSTESILDQPDQFRQIYSFKGIPYAKPPLRELRFRKPEPLLYEKMSEVDASHFKKSCKQPPLPSLIRTGYNNFVDSSEDCLYLNVYTPSLNRSSNLPVIVFINGGELPFQTSRQVMGEQLSIRDVVVVTMNYRLGVFGFLCTDREDAPGNVGLWDQAMAINWTVNNIRNFGGDPDQITLFGESAGAVAVTSHIVSNVSQDMFIRAIIHSGSSLTNVWLRSKQYSTRVAKRFAKFVGCPRHKDYIKCLRNKSAEELLTVQSTAFLWNLNTTDARPWYSAAIFEFVQCFGDQFLPKNVHQLLDSTHFNKDIRVLTGHTVLESAQFTYFYDLMKGHLLGTHSAQMPDAVITTKMAKHYIQRIMINNQSFDGMIAEEYTKTFNDSLILSPKAFFERQRLRAAVVHSFSDYAFVCPTVLFGKYLVSSPKFTGKVFQYYLSYANNQSLCKSSTWCKNTHFDELPLAFGQPFYMKGFSDLDKKMSSVLMDIFTAFAKTKEAPIVNGYKWPEYNLNQNGEVSLNFMELDSTNLGQTFTNKYIGNNGFTPNAIQNCKLWEPILRSLF